MKGRAVNGRDTPHALDRQWLWAVLGGSFALPWRHRDRIYAGMAWTPKPHTKQARCHGQSSPVLRPAAPVIWGEGAGPRRICGCGALSNSTTLDMRFSKRDSNCFVGGGGSLSHRLRMSILSKNDRGVCIREGLKRHGIHRKFPKNPQARRPPCYPLPKPSFVAVFSLMLDSDIPSQNGPSVKGWLALARVVNPGTDASSVNVITIPGRKCP